MGIIDQLFKSKKNKEKEAKLKIQKEKENLKNQRKYFLIQAEEMLEQDKESVMQILSYWIKRSDDITKAACIVSLVSTDLAKRTLLDFTDYEKERLLKEIASMPILSEDYIINAIKELKKEVDQL